MKANRILRLLPALLASAALWAVTATGASARDDHDGGETATDHGTPAAAPLPPNNIVACFAPPSGSNGGVPMNGPGGAVAGDTTDPLADCPGGTVVPLLSISIGANVPSVGSQTSGAGAGKVTFAPVNFTKPVDAFSKTLFQYALAGMALPRVSVAFYDGNGKVVAWFKLGLVLVSAVNYSDAVAPGGSAVESGTLLYGGAITGP